MDETNALRTLHWALVLIRTAVAKDAKAEAFDLADTFESLPQDMASGTLNAERFEAAYLLPLVEKYPRDDVRRLIQLWRGE